MADASADPELVALDLAAQAEHGAGRVARADLPGRVTARRGRRRAAGVGRRPAERYRRHRRAGGSSSDEAALALAEDLAPEHLELIAAGADELAQRVRRAGCVFIGPASATAFGDYIAGSNHVLPTDGAARFAGALSPATFRRRMSRVRIGDAAAARLAPPGAALARAEGFPVHAESMERRARMEA